MRRSLLRGLPAGGHRTHGADAPGFAVSERSQAFRARFYPEASDGQWSDWRWQVRKGIRTLASLQRILRLSDDERRAIGNAASRGFLPMSLPPYYASLLDPDDPLQGLRRTVIPVGTESVVAPHEVIDPLAEDEHTVAPGLVHRYPDRVLFLSTKFCASYCRFCTRSRLVGENGETYNLAQAHWEEALAYIRAHPEIRDVLISGGDPLMLSDKTLESLLSALADIPHVEFIRMGTKAPVALPQRITPSLLEILHRYRPVWMSINVTSKDEITPEAAQACQRLADAGVPMGSQTVLLRGVNDSVDEMREMMQALLQIRVRPYYLYQLDPVAGTSHFRVPVSKGLEIIAGLRGHTTGYAVPTYVIDCPGGGGKVPISPDNLVGRDGDELLIKNFEGKVFRAPDPRDIDS